MQVAFEMIASVILAIILITLVAAMLYGCGMLWGLMLS